MHVIQVADENLKTQFDTAVRDLWSMLYESTDDYVIFMDRRRMRTRVDRTADGQFRASWETDDDRWIEHDRQFENLREAALHAYQGPH